MANTNHKALLKDIETSNLRLPEIKRIRIENISDSDTNLSSFFENCTPNQLKFLSINYTTTSIILIKSKICIKSLSKAVVAVTKEIYIRLYEFSAADLQQFVRAACNAERIVFQRCSVHCSPSLDFGSDLKYNTKFLSFQVWGNIDYKELTTDWISDPSCFSHIVDAIGCSGLRRSLSKLSICSNQTLDKTKMQVLPECKGNGTHFSCWGIFIPKLWIRRIENECNWYNVSIKFREFGNRLL